jgi:hypothetical protein
MKRIFLLMIVSMLTTGAGALAQKFNPSLAFLKGEKSLNVVFDYQGVTIDGDPEEKFVKEEMDDEKNDEDKQEWKENWYGKWRETYKYAFLNAINLETGETLSVSEHKDAEYTAIVKIKDIDPGNFAGPFSNPAKIKAIISIIKTSDNSVITKAEFKDIYTPAGIAPLMDIRIAAGFSELGETLGEIIMKTIK